MQLNFKPPPPLKFYDGTPDEFAVQLRRHTGVERCRIFDAVRSGSVEPIQMACDPLVIGISGLKDDAGNILLLETPEDNGRRERQWDRILGAMTFDDQVDVTNAIVAFVGLVERMPKARPTGGSGSSTSPTAPASSSNGATSPS